MSSINSNLIDKVGDVFNPRDFVIDLYKKGHSVQFIYERLFLSLRGIRYGVTLNECKHLTESYVLDYLRYNIP